jgi:hypothetical protein
MSDDVTILLGAGNGSFVAASVHEAGIGPISVAVGDFNNDGNDDLVVANQMSDKIAILLSSGDRSFAVDSFYSAGVMPRSVTVGDFDDDGNDDLVVANWCSDNVAILLGSCDGSFDNGSYYGAGDRPMSVAVGDFDNDGNDDLAVVNYNSNNIAILMNKLSGDLENRTERDLLLLRVNRFFQNYLDPFNPTPTITYEIPGNKRMQGLVKLTVYDIRGRYVKTLVDADLPSGTHKVRWDGRNDRGESVASGIYLYTLKAGGERFTRKMTVLK